MEEDAVGPKELKFPSPLYEAVILWAPIPRLEVDSEYGPAPETPEVPILLPPFRYVIVPVGVPPPGAVRLVPIVTAWPNVLDAGTEGVLRLTEAFVATVDWVMVGAAE